jgi:predicted AAA+ superfamily ATPase
LKVALSIFKDSIIVMIKRTAYLAELRRKLKSSPIVALLGPTQAGKTTLAQAVVQGAPHPFFLLWPFLSLSGLTRCRKPLTWAPRE